ncbi:zinc-binding dehydrogenase [Pseudomonas fakonensis]|uniref:Zinc-binding dehydrogenase n=1 Tax=Pseudomonas fakonensis TaxID=2842355 RepID=A0ABX8NE61_9PSED|nr:zinc-binding dehydrogenase [Pseudomonas fakonensis]
MFETGPVIDAVYPFEKAEEALEHLRSANHFGKRVIQVSAPGA